MGSLSRASPASEVGGGGQGGSSWPHGPGAGAGAGLPAAVQFPSPCPSEPQAALRASSGPVTPQRWEGQPGPWTPRPGDVPPTPEGVGGRAEVWAMSLLSPAAWASGGPPNPSSHRLWAPGPGCVGPGRGGQGRARESRKRTLPPQPMQLLWGALGHPQSRRPRSLQLLLAPPCDRVFPAKCSPQVPRPVLQVHGPSGPARDSGGGWGWVPRSSDRQDTGQVEGKTETGFLLGMFINSRMTRPDAAI